MGKQTPDTAIFLTRQDVANLLRMTPHNVDLLARKGKLEKTKLGPGRTGIHRDSVSQYLANLNSSVSTSVSAPQSAHAIPSGAHEVNMVGDNFGSAGMALYVDVDGDVAQVSAALDAWLPSQGVRGCFIMDRAGRVVVLWARNLGLDPAVVRKAVEAVKVTVLHAAE
jgi:hypothetical protein